jgi:hypothetical protein
MTTFDINSALFESAQIRGKIVKVPLFDVLVY